MHSRWANYGGTTAAHGEHDGYVPGEFDPDTGLTNSDTKGYVRAWNHHPQRVSGPGGLLAQLQPFTGHSLRAFRAEHLDGGFTYKVYSYNVCIAQWRQPKWKASDPGRDLPIVHLDYSYYTPKTREHQNMVNAWMGYSVDQWIDATIV